MVVVEACIYIYIYIYIIVNDFQKDG